MKKSDGLFSRGRVRDYALAAMEQMELYCQAHPASPSAVRRPRLFVRGDLWVALLGPSVEEGIVGIGPSVTAALRAFDAQYLAGLRPRRKLKTIDLREARPPRLSDFISKNEVRVSATSLSQPLLNRDTNQR